MNTLFLRLEGPLQSWGLRAHWGQRDTASAPTKSGVIGLLGAALGLRRDAPELRRLSDELRMGVRVDLPGTLLRDYHTTGGGRYGEAVHLGGSRFHDEPYAGGVLSPEVVKGRIKVKINAATKEPETDTSERFYLADASFLVALQAGPDTIARLAQALRAPVWPVFLGRKSCPPAEPVLGRTGQHENPQAALESEPIPPRVREAWRRQGGRPASLRLLIETTPGAGSRQNDNIGNPSRRVFHPRAVAEVWWPLPPEPAEATLANPEPPLIDTLEG